MTNQAATYVERLEHARDLRNELGTLDREDESGIVFQEWSPGRVNVVLWSTESGEEIVIPKYMAQAALSAPREDGRGYRFTALKANAPVPKVNSTRCFLADDSPERVGGLLEKAGLGGRPACPAKQLAGPYDKRVHADHRHHAAWEMFQAAIGEDRDAEFRRQQQEQTAAMMALAGKTAMEPPKKAG